MATVAITGATGLIGGALTRSLEDDGHIVHRVTRSASVARPNDIIWDPEKGSIDASRLEGVDAVVHLAAEPLGADRWSEATKHRIVSSRELGTRLIAETIAGLDDPPAVLLSASAVGYYGEGGAEPLTEDAPPADDFLAHVCQVWESSAEPARAAGIRVVHPRTGVVIARGGPLLDKLEMPFKLGVGGPVGSGRQFVPWISFEDHIRALRFLIDHDELEGPVNLVGPVPTTNRRMSKALGRVLHRPAVLPVPLFAVGLVYGKGGRTLAAVSQRAVPRRLEQAGFEFRHQTIEEALEAVLGRGAAA
jgi:uncharacterized protein